MPEESDTTQDVVFGESLPEDELRRDKVKPKRKVQKLDSSVRRDVAFLQKKIGELEIAISEVQENIQKIDLSGLEDLKQRVEDVEDLTMVENAGIIELKKFLEELKEKTGTTTSIPTELEDRINNLEQKIVSLPEMKKGVTPDLSGLKELEDSVQAVKNEFQNRFGEINQALSELENRVAEGVDKERLKEEIKNSVTSLIPDFHAIKKELEDSIEVIKFNVDNYKKELERIKQDVEEKLNTPLQGKLLKELEEIKSESLVVNSKVDAIDSFVKELSKEVSEVRPLINRLDSKVTSLEGLSDVEKSIDEKLDDFRDVLRTAESFKESSQALKEIDNFLSRFKDIEKRLAEMRKFVDEFERSKEDVLTSRWRVDYKRLVEDMDRKFEKLRRELEIRLQEEKYHTGENEINKKLEKIDMAIKSLENDMSVFQGNLMVLEKRQTDISSIAELSSRKQPKSEELAKRLEYLETEIQNIKSVNVDDKLSELDRKINIALTSTSFDEQLSEIVSRLVFVESRLAALEGRVQDTRYAPIVVE